jgi:hypothetical protein
MSRGRYGKTECRKPPHRQHPADLVLNTRSGEHKQRPPKHRTAARRVAQVTPTQGGSSNRSATSTRARWATAVTAPESENSKNCCGAVRPERARPWKETTWVCATEARTQGAVSWQRWKAPPCARSNVRPRWSMQPLRVWDAANCRRCLGPLREKACSYSAQDTLWCNAGVAAAHQALLDGGRLRGRIDCSRICFRDRPLQDRQNLRAPESSLPSSESARRIDREA